MSDLLKAGELVGAAMTANTATDETGAIEGHYCLECRDAQGNLLWSDKIENLVVTAGQNQLLASGIAGTGTQYMGLTNGGTPNAADTMASHSGWIELGGTNAPPYTGNRASLTFANPSGGSMATSSTNSFVFNGASGTVGGAFVVFGSGASATKDSTTGVLLSAGTLAAAQPVINGNTIQMSYTLTL